jgi:hypothetical protein
MGARKINQSNCMKKPKPKQLGELGISEYFRKKGGKTTYRTITHMSTKHWTTLTKRHCLNMKTLKAEYIFCKDMVIVISEDSKDTEN